MNDYVKRGRRLAPAQRGKAGPVTGLTGWTDMASTPGAVPDTGPVGNPNCSSHRLHILDATAPNLYCTPESDPPTRLTATSVARPRWRERTSLATVIAVLGRRKSVTSWPAVTSGTGKDQGAESLGEMSEPVGAVRTATQNTVSATAVGAVVVLLADPTRIPEWAPAVSR